MKACFCPMFLKKKILLPHGADTTDFPCAVTATAFLLNPLLPPLISQIDQPPSKYCKRQIAMATNPNPTTGLFILKSIVSVGKQHNHTIYGSEAMKPKDNALKFDLFTLVL